MNRSLRHSPLFGWSLAVSDFFRATSPHPKMKVAKPFFSSQCVSAGIALSHLVAGIHYGILSARLTKFPHNITGAKATLFKDLKSAWSSVVVRKVISVLVRSPLRRNVLRLIKPAKPFPFNSGCVITICHTPWKRLLVQWCLENDFALVVAAGEWAHDKRRIQVQGCGTNDLRDVMRHLKHNGRLIIAFDMFNNMDDCPVDFLGNKGNVSLLPARLAKMAQVPLVSLIPSLRDGRIHIGYGPQFDVNDVKGNSAHIMQKILSSFEGELKSDPGIWPAGYGESLGFIKKPFALPSSI